MDSVQLESENEELELLELALAQSSVAIDNLEEVILRWLSNQRTEHGLLLKTTLGMPQR
jgi:hypothetical protein